MPTCQADRPRRRIAFGLRVTLTLTLALATSLGACRTARAHSASTSYLTVVHNGDGLDVQWEIALRDLDYAIGLDDTGRITWGDLKRRTGAIETYVLPRLSLTADGRSCAPGPVTMLADERGGTGFAVLRFRAACTTPIHRIGVRYGLMFNLDPTHRALVDIVSNGAFHVAALSPASPSMVFESGGASRTFADFFRVGIDHIMSGPDHLLFIALLLLPAMFRRDANRHWQPVARFTPAFIETVEILSAFTIAHAITVTAAILGWIEIPSRIVEGAIALTIAATALDNIVPVLPERRWVLAFGFGLIHGIGFATALGPLSLPAWPLAVALFAFNTGVETAQLSAAAIVLPIGYGLRNFPLYPARVLPALSGVAGLVALAWFAERTLRLT